MTLTSWTIIGGTYSWGSNAGATVTAAVGQMTMVNLVDAATELGRCDEAHRTDSVDFECVSRWGRLATPDVRHRKGALRLSRGARGQVLRSFARGSKTAQRSSIGEFAEITRVGQRVQWAKMLEEIKLGLPGRHFLFIWAA